MQNSPFSPRRWSAVLALLTCTLVFAASAQADPTGRIGRISLLSGTVNLYNPNSGNSFAAPLNQPLTSGDILTTEPGSRTEIQIGSTTVRLDAGSRLEFDRIDDDQVGLYLDEGRSIVKLSSPDAVNDFVMETRNGRFTAPRTGVYRFDTDANSTTGTAYYGTLHFEASDSALDIGSGQHAQFWQDGQTHYRFLTPPNDEFTQWSAARDQRPAATTYSRYVSPEMTGAEDLDAHGNWSETPEYGAVWYPRAVAAGWAPYRSGHWSWVAPWGWTWVGDEPWGFAPFHYGRWVHHRGAWGWVPGTRIARPVYAPAMVAWIGSPSASISISIGSRPTVGWFPLAPREVYIPAYRSSEKHIRNVNITHVTHINNVTNIVNNPLAAAQHTRYSHRERPQAVTFVPADVVTHRRPVAREAISPRDQHALRNQPISVAAPVSAPQVTAPRVESRHRQERQNPAFVRPDRERRAPVEANQRNISPAQAAPQTHAVAPATTATTASTRRNERPRPEMVEPRRQDTPAPVTAPQQAAPQIETRNRQDRPEHTFPRQDRQQAAQEHRAIIAQPQAPAQAPAPQVVIQRNDRPMPDVVRPVPQPRRDPVEPRIEERQHARPQERPQTIEPPQHRPSRENRIEQVVQQPVRQAPPQQRIETPPAARAIARPAEPPRPEARPQQQQAERRQRPPQQDDEDLRRRRKNEAEKR